MSKILEHTIFQNFHAIFVKFSTDFVDWNVETRKKEKSNSPVGFSEEMNAIF